MLTNTKNSYGYLAKILHWVPAMLITVMLGIGASFNVIKEPLVGSVVAFHKTLGLTILLLMTLRLLWKCINPTPALPPNSPFWHHLLSKCSHTGLYALIFIMLLSGIIMSVAGGHPLSFWGWFPVHLPFIPLDKPLSKLANTIHYYTAWTLTAAIILHIGAALVHHYYYKDNILLRMLFNRQA